MQEDYTMGLMKCPDCGKDISERAVTCIHCGCPIREWQAEQKTTEETHGSGTEETQDAAEEAGGKISLRNRILAIAGVLIIAGVGIFFAVKSLIKPDYYQEGLKVTKQFGEVIRSDDYLSLYFNDPDVLGSDVRERLKGINYDSPSAVYSIQNTDKEKYIRLLGNQTNQMERWERMPDSLKKQIEYFINAGVLANLSNANYGSNVIALSSIAKVVYQSDSLNNAEPLEYLYVYPHEVSILVSFSRGTATGQFVLFDGFENLSQTELQELFGRYGFEIKKVQ